MECVLKEVDEAGTWQKKALIRYSAQGIPKMIYQGVQGGARASVGLAKTKEKEEVMTALIVTQKSQVPPFPLRPFIVRGACSSCTP